MINTGVVPLAHESKLCKTKLLLVAAWGQSVVPHHKTFLHLLGGGVVPGWDIICMGWLTHECDFLLARLMALLLGACREGRQTLALNN